MKITNILIAIGVVIGIFFVSQSIFAKVVPSSTGTIIGSYPASVSVVVSMAFDSRTNSVWVTNGESVTKINSLTGAIIGIYPAHSSASITFDMTQNVLWFANYDSNTVTKMNPLTGSVIGVYPAGAAPQGVVHDSYTNSIWVVNNGANTVTKLDASTGAIVGVYAVGADPFSPVFDPSTNSIWVVNIGSNTVTKINSLNGAILGTYSTGVGPNTAVFDPSTNSIWVTSLLGNKVLKINSTTGAITGSYPVNNPGYVAFDPLSNSIWVTNTWWSNTVTKINTSDGSVFGVYHSSAGVPFSIIFDPSSSSMWVADYDLWLDMIGQNSTVTKISTGVQTGAIITTSNIPASWTIAGPATITGSGTTQSSPAQPTGIYTIIWNPVAGYTTPASQSLTLTTGGTIAFSATYTALCTYSCPAGNTVIGSGPSTTCQAPSSCTYSCPAGSTLSGSTCQAPASQPAGVAATATTNDCPSAVTTYPVPDGYGWGGQFWTMRFPASFAKGTVYRINTYGWNGIVCATALKTLMSKAAPAYMSISYFSWYPVTTTYSCPAGYTLSGTTCYPPAVTPAPTSATASCTAPARTSGIASASCTPVPPIVSFQGAGCILPVGGGSCNITAWWSVSGLPAGETLDINVTGPGIALNYKNLPADSTLLAQAVTKAQNLAAIILGFPTAKPQATPFSQPVSSTGSFSMSLLQHGTGATLATLPPLVSCPAGYTIVNGACVAPVVLTCTTPNVTAWSSCQSSATCTTPPSKLTGQPGFRTGTCPTPTYTGNVIEACSSATVPCTAPPTVCGNGICEAGETFINCSKDCRMKVREF